MYCFKVKNSQNYASASIVDSFLVKTATVEDLFDGVRGNSGYNFLLEKN